jgi:uncharacterized protein GlcG (DUF336 family)
MRFLRQWLGRSSDRVRRPGRAPLGVERLEGRDLPSVSAALAGGVLTITGGPERDNIRVLPDPGGADLVVYNFLQPVGQFTSAAVQSIVVDGGGGQDRVVIDPQVTQPASLRGGDSGVVLQGGGGPTELLGGTGNDKLVAGAGPTRLDGDGGSNTLLEVKPSDTVVSNPGDRVCFALVSPTAPAPPPVTLSTDDVQTLLDRAEAASASNDAIIAVVDRGGRILGVRLENGVDPAITASPASLTFAVDGAVSEARTGAFFANNQAPLTSRTVQFISQSTITQREVQSSPDVLDRNSTLYGPGFVAPIGIKAHFPPNVPYTPQVDLFNIEGTNRDSLINPGPDGIRGTADDITLPSRFNVPLQFIPASIPPDERLTAPESYGLVSALFPAGQSRGIGTLPGGIPIFKDGQLVGGIGVFFPGKTGFASEENSSLSATFDPTKRDRSLEAEYMAFAAAGGSSQAGFPIGTVGGVPPLPGFDLPFGRIDLVGITLDIFGPGGTQGPQNLVNFGKTLGTGDPTAGRDLPVTPGANGQFDTAGAELLRPGTPVPDGWLVTPHDGEGVTAAQVQQIIEQGIAQAQQTRAAIRLPLGSRTEMVFAVADRSGAILGLFRMPDATVFSIDVAVAKARNVAYYADPSQLQPIDQVPGIPPGVAFTNRTFRYLAEPRFPEGIAGAPPGPFSILNDGGTDPNTGLTVGPPLPASAFQSVQGFDAFHPGTNFHDPNNPLNQNGIVFFPGSAPLYRSGALIGGFGVSGDGVDQDDVVTSAGAAGFEPPPSLQVDQFFFNSIRLPYQKFDRNPEG